MNSHINHQLRKKVDEVDFGYQEADWEKMSAMLATQKKPAWVIWSKRAPLLLLLLGGASLATWALWPTDSSTAPIAEVNPSEYEQVMAMNAPASSASTTEPSVGATSTAWTNADATLQTLAMTDNSAAAPSNAASSASTTANTLHSEYKDGSSTAHGSGGSSAISNPTFDAPDNSPAFISTTTEVENQSFPTDAFVHHEMAALNVATLPTERKEGELAIPANKEFDYAYDSNEIGHPSPATTVYFNFWNNPGYTGMEELHNIYIQRSVVTPSDRFVNKSFLAAYDGSFGEQKQLGVGAFFFQRATDTRKTTRASLNLSYQLNLGDHRLRFGAGATNITQRLDIDKLNFGDAIHPQNGFIGNSYEQLDDKASGWAVSTGVFYTHKKFYAGLAFTDLNQPNLSVLGQSSPVSRRTELNMGYRITRFNKLHLIPSMNVAYFDQIVRYRPALLTEYNEKILLGLSYQSNDLLNFTNLQLVAGANIYDRFRVLMSASLPNGQRLNGENKIWLIEAGLRYQFGKFAAPKTME